MTAIMIRIALVVVLLMPVTVYSVGIRVLTMVRTVCISSYSNCSSVGADVSDAADDVGGSIHDTHPSIVLFVLSITFQ